MNMPAVQPCMTLFNTCGDLVTLGETFRCAVACFVTCHCLIVAGKEKW